MLENGIPLYGMFISSYNSASSVSQKYVITGVPGATKLLHWITMNDRIGTIFYIILSYVLHFPIVKWAYNNREMARHVRPTDTDHIVYGLWWLLSPITFLMDIAFIVVGSIFYLVGELFKCAL